MASRGPNPRHHHFKDYHASLARSFKAPEISVSGHDIFPDPEHSDLPALMIMMNEQAFDEMHSLLQKPRHIINVDDYYICTKWSEPKFAVDELSCIPTAESVVANFIYINLFSSAAPTEAAKAANVEGNIELAQDDESDGFPYFDSLSARYIAIGTGELPPMIPESDDLEKENKHDAVRVQEDRETDLVHMVTQCMHRILKAEAFPKIACLEVSLPTFAGGGTQGE